MKKNAIAILMLSMTFLGLQYALFGEEEIQYRLGNIAVALIFGVVFHFGSKGRSNTKYIFSDKSETEK